MLLSVQYRMHPQIRAFPSSYFYGGRLVDAPAVLARPPAPFYNDPCGCERRASQTWLRAFAAPSPWLQVFPRPLACAFAAGPVLRLLPTLLMLAFIWV
jgi:hypothetical protein